MTDNVEMVLLYLFGNSMGKMGLSAPDRFQLATNELRYNSILIAQPQRGHCPNRISQKHFNLELELFILL